MTDRARLGFELIKLLEKEDIVMRIAVLASKKEMSAISALVKNNYKGVVIRNTFLHHRFAVRYFNPVDRLNGFKMKDAQFNVLIRENGCPYGRQTQQLFNDHLARINGYGPHEFLF